MDWTGSPHSELERLKREIDKTWRTREAASIEFDLLVREVPSQIPEPDGSLRIRQAKARMSQAIDAHYQTVRRYVDLVTQRAEKPGDH